MRKLLSIMAFFVISLLAISLVAAVPEKSTLGDLIGFLDIGIEVNGEDYGFTTSPFLFLNTTRVVVKEGEDLDIKVKFKHNGSVDAEGIEVVARISGYEYSDKVSLEDSTGLFDVKAGTRKTVGLSLKVPRDLTNGLNTLRIFVLDRNGVPITVDFPLEVESPRHSVDVEDVSFSPGNTVKAGRALLTTVLVENYGDRTEDDVKVTVAIPALGVSATDFIDEIKAGKTENVFGDFEGGLLLNIPANAAAGEYNVDVTLSYDNLKRSFTKSFKVNVLADERFTNVDKLVLAVGPEMQNVNAGSTASYGIALTNGGSVSKAYTLSTRTGDWASASLSESLVVLAPGQNAVVYVDIAVAEDAPVGQQVVAVSIMSGDETVNTVALNANVVAGSDKEDPVSLRNGLEIALIVLVVLLVIIGLIVGFSRLRKDDDEDQTYY